MKKKVNDFLCEIRNLNIFISKQTAVHIRERRQSVIHIRITLFGFGIEYTEKVNECAAHILDVKAPYVIMEFQMATENT